MHCRIWTVLFLTQQQHLKLRITSCHNTTLLGSTQYSVWPKVIRFKWCWPTFSSQGPLWTAVLLSWLRHEADTLEDRTLTSRVVRCVCTSLIKLRCLLCVSEWKNCKGPGNMRALRRAPTPCDITLLTLLFFFCLDPRHFTREKKYLWKHCDYCYDYYCRATDSTSIITCTTAFFTYPFFPLTVGEWQTP